MNSIRISPFSAMMATALQTAENITPSTITKVALSILMGVSNFYCFPWQLALPLTLAATCLIHQIDWSFIEPLTRFTTTPISRGNFSAIPRPRNMAPLQVVFNAHRTDRKRTFSEGFHTLPTHQEKEMVGRPQQKHARSESQREFSRVQGSAQEKPFSRQWGQSNSLTEEKEVVRSRESRGK